jgi:hypothetical protein
MFYQKNFCRSCTAEPDKILALILQNYIREVRRLNCGWATDYFLRFILFFLSLSAKLHCISLITRPPLSQNTFQLIKKQAPYHGHYKSSIRHSDDVKLLKTREAVVKLNLLMFSFFITFTT